MKTMVVGGAGFIGSHLVDRLLADDASVDVVDDLSHGSLANLAEARSLGADLKIHHLGAGTSEASSLIGMRQPDVLYHLAAVPRGRPSAATIASAIAATMALIDAASQHGVARVVVALPATVLYGRPASKELPLREVPLEPRGLRGVVARTTIDVLSTYRQQVGLEFAALALASVYGPRQRPDSGVVAALAAAAAGRRPPTITGDGRQTRDLLFVDDAVDALVKAGQRGSGLVVNVGTGVQTSIRDLWAQIAPGSSVDPEFVPADADALPRFALSPVRARIHLGWSPWTSVADGLAQLLR